MKDFYEDISKKVTDIFEKGFSYKAPFTFKAEMNDAYFCNYMHKSEFLQTPEGLAYDWEYKFKYEKDKKMCSTLIKKDKAELEFDIQPEFLNKKKKFVKFHTKYALSPKSAEDLKENTSHWFPLRKNWNVTGELEAKASFCKNLSHTIKMVWNPESCLPTVSLTNLLFSKPVLLGMNYIIDHSAPHNLGLFEIMMGLRPKKNFLTYLKSDFKSFDLPSKLVLGVWAKSNFKVTCDKKSKSEIKSKTLKMPIEFAAEGSIDLANKNNFEGHVGMKTSYKNKYIIQTALDQDMKLCSAFSYVPKKNMKLIWSDQINLKNLFTSPQNGIDYKYGFSLEMNLD